jgi:hypothetical protein
MRRTRVWMAMACAVFCLGALTACNLGPKSAAAAGIPTVDPARYYAVLLINGSVYFGKVEGLGSPYVVMRDVYYIQSSVNQETKETSNVLVKRGKELHGPDMMMINEKSILLVEPVGPESKVAQLIDEAHKKQ